jgi:hypothetical protein
MTTAICAVFNHLDRCAQRVRIEMAETQRMTRHWTISIFAPARCRPRLGRG